MAKEKSNPNYHQGKETGYQLINGEYHIAPLYQEQFEHFNIKRVAIQTLVNGIIDHANDDLQGILEQEQKVWEILAEDIGLDMPQEWIHQGGVVKLKNPPKIENK